MLHTILHRESDNAGHIHLYNENGHWCAYEKSAYHLTAYFPGCKLEQVLCQDAEVLLIRSVLDKPELLKEGSLMGHPSIKQQTSNYIELSHLQEVDDDIFNYWKRLMFDMKSVKKVNAIQIL